MLAVIVASHIRMRALITVLHRDAKHQGEGRSDHRSRFNPVLAVIVVSHIRMRALITVLHRDAKHQGKGRDDHRSKPDV